MQKDSPNAYRLIRKCNRNGLVRFNTEIKTLAEIAKETLAIKYAQNGTVRPIHILNSNACVLVMHKILSENRPSFLPEECISMGYFRRNFECHKQDTFGLCHRKISKR